MLALAGIESRLNRIKIDYLQVTCGVGLRHVASIGLNIVDEHFEASATGNGPVDAAIKAVKKIISREIVIQEFLIQAKDVTIKTPDGKNSFTADDATKASWITVTSAQGVVPTLSVDSAKVSAWVQAQSEEVAEEPVGVKYC